LWRYALWPLLAIATAVAFLRKRMDGWISAAIVVAWFAYVIVVGGDFMEFRFFVPIMPAIASVIAEAVALPMASPRVPNVHLRAGAAVAIALAASWHHAASFRGVAPDKTYDSVRALGSFYGLAPGGRWDLAGNALGSVLRGTSATLSCNGVGAIPYYSEVYTVDQLGLTDAWVARNGVRPPTNFLRPGHQRYATYEYLVSRRVSFVIGTPTIIETGKLAAAPLHQMVPYWVGNFLGPAAKQIPVVDLVATTVCNVMMVGMSTAIHSGRESHVIDLWHDTVRKLALVFFPLTGLLLLVAHDVIIMLFTETYVASIPIFMVGVTAVMFAAIPMDGVMRVYAKTNVLLAINLVRLAMIALLIHWSIRSFGLVGAMLVTVLALALGKVIGLGAAASMWHVGVGRVLPWRSLWLIIIVSLTALLPALAVAYGLEAAPFIRIAVISAVYGATYASMALGVGLISPHERAALTHVMGRLQFMLPVRYQHKTS